MPRAFLVVLDSVGAGGAPDAHAFFNDARPDTGANTLAHIAQACAEGRAEEGRSGPLRMPNLDALGLGEGDLVLAAAGAAVWAFERRRNAAQFGGPPARGGGKTHRFYEIGRASCRERV